MGVPKFFRWLSERYPAISQLIADNRIPEFDCLYLDMNGIIHNCTHKDAGEDVAFRLSEDEMFIRIFNYIEHLFGKIKPKKLFFMAVDGVAPRAKMNQQRARRFRTALEVEQAREAAIRKGVAMPSEPPFDSNCITPGTEFMAKLSLQLRYFINKKVSEDSDWQGCDIVLSGHEVPGEGEHKIMEYIRDAKAQPEYDPNVRHCLYGLDADLIMLGLLSHDPHFCLLREEVTFGRKTASKGKELEHQNFFLLHLCIVREYLELEFQELKEEGMLKFPYDLEKVIDDFILLAFFVGNDFLPNLPGLHINEGALATMFRLYKQILPEADGYINENGVINMGRLALLLEKLGEMEKEQFEADAGNEKWLQAKKMGATPVDEAENRHRKNPKGPLVITPGQNDLWKKKIKRYVSKRSARSLNLGSELNAADRKFVQDLADRFRLEWATKEDDEGRRCLYLNFPANGSDDEEEYEGIEAAVRIVKQYDNAVVTVPEDASTSYEELYRTKLLAWKTKYYLDKFPEWSQESYESELVALCENYVQGLQWVLFYYYRGIASWPWFYRYHYSPMTSDVVKGVGADINFHKGEPFRPYEQLMGVLPDRSKSIVPKVYWELMTNPDSPIIDFYPRDFELDMNGKKMDWEAVVKIPFIDEKRLLAAMAPKNKFLSADEKARNGFGVALKFTYAHDVSITYPSSLPVFFPDIENCHCVENIFELPPTEGLDYRVGLMDGAKLSIEALSGFPSLHTLPYGAALVEGFGVKVFQSESKNSSMVITLGDSDARTRTEANKPKLGKRCFVGYPFLQEARIIKVSDELFDYVLARDGSTVTQNHHTLQQIKDFARDAAEIEKSMAKRLAIAIGTVETLVTVEMFKGLIKTEDGALVKEYNPGEGPRYVYAAQTVVDEVVNEDERFLEKAALPIEEEFPVGTSAFFLGEYQYGQVIQVAGHCGNKLDVVVRAYSQKEPEFAKDIVLAAERANMYKPSYAVARELGLHPLVLSKVTSSFFLNTIGGLRVNLGLNLKFDTRRQKVLGYSRKTKSGWEFSANAIMLLSRYMAAFPDFFAAISRMPLKGDISDSDVWPDRAVASQRIKDMAAWLKQQDTNRFERVPLDAEQLDSNVVMKLAEVGEMVHRQRGDTINQKMMGVPRPAVLKPRDAELVLSNQKFEVGDRVTYAADVGKVPIAFRGTVVGLTRTAIAMLLDVVWDASFMSGTTLGGRSPGFRGQTVAAWTVINCTSRQLIRQSKAAAARRDVRVIASEATGTYGPADIPQLTDASPPPPFRMSYSGVIRGGHGNRGGRARGSVPFLIHSQDVYHIGPPGNGNGWRGPGGGGSSEGHQPTWSSPAYGASPKPAGGYHAVPPPAGLNNSPGSRGRGRGRGRGGSGAGAVAIRGSRQSRGGGVEAEARGGGARGGGDGPRTETAAPAVEWDR